jgi:hypothetical protein
MDEQLPAVTPDLVRTLQGEIVRLRAENGTLRERVQQLEGQRHADAARLAQLEAEVARATARVSELEQGAQRRLFGKARPQRAAPAPPRRARAPEHNHARRREEPTGVETHQYEHCPDCGYRLRDGSVWWERQVVDLPPPAPAVVTAHRFVRRWCPVCRKWQAPPLPSDLALGQGRLGLGVASLVATLRTTLRLPIAQIQLYLQTVHGLHLSCGALVDLLRRVAQVAEPAVTDLLEQARASPILHGDETGWREDGQHGYLWFLTTPGLAPVCYVAYDQSRAGAVVTGLLGDFHGHLVSDFYGAYNVYAGKHQRCWVHLLRLLHTLKERQPQDWTVQAWARAVRRLYDRATAFVRQPQPPTPAQRQFYYDRLVAISHRLGLRYAQATGHPCRGTAKTLLRHEAELFQFVLIPGLAADNNLAERRLRPLTVARKISGGTRSPEGSTTRARLTSLFATWQARGLNPFTACLALLVSLLSKA